MLGVLHTPKMQFWWEKVLTWNKMGKKQGTLFEIHWLQMNMSLNFIVSFPPSVSTSVLGSRSPGRGALYLFVASAVTLHGQWARSLCLELAASEVSFSRDLQGTH